MSLRNMEVQYVGDTLYLPPLEREVKHIVVREADVADWMRYEHIVRCCDCKHRAGENVQAVVSDLCMWLNIIVKPDGFCAWAERRDA